MSLIKAVACMRLNFKFTHETSGSRSDGTIKADEVLMKASSPSHSSLCQYKFGIISLYKKLMAWCTKCGQKV